LAASFLRDAVRQIATFCEEQALTDPDFRIKARGDLITFLTTLKSIKALPCTEAACRGWRGALAIDEVASVHRLEEVWPSAKVCAAPTMNKPSGYPILLITTPPMEAGTFAQCLFKLELPNVIRHHIDLQRAKREGLSSEVTAWATRQISKEPTTRSRRSPGRSSGRRARHNGEQDGDFKT